MKKSFIIILIAFIGLAISFRVFCGIFVIQPIGALPKGTTIVYMRIGSNLPFLSSADGLLKNSTNGVSLLSRGIMLANVMSSIKGKEIVRIAYSETLYLWSTGGSKYEK